MTTKLENDEDEVYMMNLVASLNEEELFGEHVKPTCMIEEVEEESYISEGAISEGANYFEKIFGVKEAIATIETDESQSGSQLVEVVHPWEEENCNLVKFPKVKEAKAKIEIGNSLSSSFSSSFRSFS
ncbi:unnamed protein product [Calypogeia fissa]